jgi:glutaredoxin-dependent peroxiredoxin
MSLQIGDKAPDFSLYASDKELVNLADYKGKNVVILFFPLAFTSTCTKELCATRDDIETYNALDAEVLAISVDSIHSLRRYKEDYQLNFRLLSDFNKEVSTNYSAIYQEFGFGMKGVSKRAAFVVDGDGVIQYAEVLENAGLLPDLEAVQNTLRKLHVA